MNNRSLQNAVHRILLAAALLAPIVGPAVAEDKPRDTSELPQSSARSPEASLRDIRVQVVAVISAVIGAPMPGRLSEFPLRDGDRFQKGQVLAKFVCAERDGALAHARAMLDAKRRVFSNKQQLRSLGTSTGLEYDIAAGEVNEAAAEVTVNQAMVDSCTIIAPFSGRVASVSVHAFQFIALGAPLMEILSDQDLEMEMIVPSRWLSWLKVGAPFNVVIDENSKTYHAELSRVSGKVDPVSRSIKVYAVVKSPTEDLLPGMSGRALLTPAPGEH